MVLFQVSSWSVEVEPPRRFTCEAVWQVFFHFFGERYVLFNWRCYAPRGFPESNRSDGSRARRLLCEVDAHVSLRVLMDAGLLHFLHRTHHGPHQ